MIATEIIPSFYIIEIEGEAVKCIIPGDFGIDKIFIGSRDFSNDMSATVALKKAMSFIIINPDLKTDHLVPGINEHTEYNPEFFPSLQPIKLTIEQQDQLNEFANNSIQANEIYVEQGKVAVQLTKFFDTLGDFVEIRWTIESNEFKIQGKVAVNPDKYLYQKALEIANSNSLIPKIGTTAIH